MRPYGVAPSDLACVFLLIGAIISLPSIHPGFGSAPVGSLSLAAIKEGLDFLRHRPVVLSAMVLDMLAVTFGGANALLPIYARDILQVGPVGLGIMRGARTVGGAVATVAMTLMPPVKSVGRILIIMIFLYGLSTIAFGLAMWFPLSLFFFALTGLTDQVSVVVCQSIVQLGTPDALRGRVSSVNQVFTRRVGSAGRCRVGACCQLDECRGVGGHWWRGHADFAGHHRQLVPPLWSYKIGNTEEQKDKAQ